MREAIRRRNAKREMFAMLRAAEQRRAAFFEKEVIRAQQSYRNKISMEVPSR